MTKFFILLLLLSPFLKTYAGFDQEINLFFRCYGQVVRERLKPSHSFVSQIKNGKISGVDACLMLIKSAKLGQDGRLKHLDDPISQKVLRTFQAFHSNWFPRYELNSNSQDHPNYNIFDKNEMAYHITHALFSEKGRYSQIFTSKDSYKSIRVSKVKNAYTNDRDISGFRHAFDDPDMRWIVGGFNNGNNVGGGAEYIYRPSLVKYGTLIGVERMDKNKNKFKRLVKGKRGAEINLNKILFSGVMGTVPYLLLNFSHNEKKNPTEEFCFRGDGLRQSLMICYVVKHHT